jgi:hypothetical protein
MLREHDTGDKVAIMRSAEMHLDALGLREETSKLWLPVGIGLHDLEVFPASLV